MKRFSGRFLSVVDEIYRKNPFYAKEAYTFVYEALEIAARALDLSPDQHLSGVELVRIGVVPLAFQRWGWLAKDVLAFWSIHSSSDIGSIVKSLVEVGVFKQSENDAFEEFSTVDLARELDRLVGR